MARKRDGDVGVGKAVFAIEGIERERHLHAMDVRKLQLAVLFKWLDDLSKAGQLYRPRVCRNPLDESE